MALMIGTFKCPKFFFSPKMLVINMPNIYTEGQFFQACTLGKHNRKNALNTNLHYMKTPFDLIHTNVCGPFNNTFLYGVRYVLTFTNDCIKFGWVFFLEKKNDGFSSIQTV